MKGKRALEELHVTFYTKENCPLCDEAEEILNTLKNSYPFTIEKVDIYKDDHLLEKYQIRIPVIKVFNKVIAEGIVTESELAEAFQKMVKR